MREKADNPRETSPAQIGRREGLKLSVASIMASLLPIPALSATQTLSPPQKEGTMADNTAIRPFHFEASQADLTDLRRRISATKWPDREQVADATQGVQLATMQALAEYWATKHDWRKCEAKINAVPNFITTIDGLDIHFIHVRSRHENALPMIVTHGWPGSIIEQMKIIDPLTNPTAHGGTVADAFHLVIPSLPGYGFSGKPTKPGWNPVTIAKAWATLMQRLGYATYVAQGGDWGNAVSEVMALQQPPGLVGIHTNMAATVPPDVSRALSAGGPPPAGLLPEEKFAWDGLDDFYKNGLGYANEMALRPQTLYGIADSPVGLPAQEAKDVARTALGFDIKALQPVGIAREGHCGRGCDGAAGIREGEANRAMASRPMPDAIDFLCDGFAQRLCIDECVGRQRDTSWHRGPDLLIDAVHLGEEIGRILDSDHEFHSGSVARSELGLHTSDDARLGGGASLGGFQRFDLLRGGDGGAQGDHAALPGGQAVLQLGERFSRAHVATLARQGQGPVLIVEPSDLALGRDKAKFQLRAGRPFDDVILQSHDPILSD
jgi:pimeloyl-ACP methyl ester carboxylesterase